MLRTFPLLSLFLMTALLSARAAPAPAPPPTVDLLPLKKALAPLGNTSTLQTHSTLRMTGAKQSILVALREDLQITSRHPGHFHAVITQYASAAGPQTKLEVISNGVLVWTYRPGSRQYSVMTLAAFKKADSDIPALGLAIGGFSLGDGRPLVEGFQSITGKNSAEVIAMLAGSGVQITRITKSVGGQDDYVYSIIPADQNLVYKFYVNSQTSVLARVELSGTDSGIQMTYREDIQNLLIVPPVPASTFVFVSPPGTLKTDTVTINPY